MPVRRNFWACSRMPRYVVTNSFHGTVFSVQFHRPFFTTVSPAELSAPERSRTVSILSRLGLANRVIGKGDTAELLDPVDWEAAEAALTAARKDSLNYLQAALEDRPYAPEAPLLLRALPRSWQSGAAAPAVPPAPQAVPMTPLRWSGTKLALISRKWIWKNASIADAVPGCARFCRSAVRRLICPLPFAAWNRDDAVRKDSTSGGAFTAIAEYVLEGGGVVYGAAMDGHQHLRHIPCFRKEDLWRLRGAKYVQSDLDGVFREIREVLKTRPVLFSGTPCQVDGLYRFLGCRPENLTTCDLVCHGVPSPGVWRTRPGLSKEINGGGWQMSASAIRWRGGRTATLPLYMTMALRIPHPCLPQALAGPLAGHCSCARAATVANIQI